MQLRQLMQVYMSSLGIDHALGPGTVSYCAYCVHVLSTYPYTRACISSQAQAVSAPQQRMQVCECTLKRWARVS